MITPQSRYANTPVTTITDHRGPHQVMAPVPNYTGSFAFTYYQVEEGDTPEWIAYSTYDDGRLWWTIANANPEILDWTDLPVGTILRIPSALD